MKAFPKKITAGVLFACLAFQMTSCSLISKGLKQFDEHENERFTGILNEKASDYGIDASSAEVMDKMPISAFLFLVKTSSACCMSSALYL